MAGRKKSLILVGDFGGTNTRLAMIDVVKDHFFKSKLARSAMPHFPEEAKSRWPTYPEAGMECSFYAVEVKHTCRYVDASACKPPFDHLKPNR